MSGNYIQIIGPDGKPQMIYNPSSGDSGGGGGGAASGAGGGGSGGGGRTIGGGSLGDDTKLFHVGVHSDVTAGIEAAMGAGVLDRIFGNIKLSMFQLNATVKGFQLPGIQSLIVPTAASALKGQKTQR